MTTRHKKILAFDKILLEEDIKTSWKKAFLFWPVIVLFSNSGLARESCEDVLPLLKNTDNLKSDKQQHSQQASRNREMENQVSPKKNAVKHVSQMTPQLLGILQEHLNQRKDNVMIDGKAVIPCFSVIAWVQD